MVVLRLLVIGFVCLVGGVVGAEDRTEEPAESYSLSVDGKSVPLVLGEEVELQVGAERAKVRLEVAPLRTFPYGGVRFSYPRYFTFEAKPLEDPKGDQWTLSGRNASILILRAEAMDLETEALMQEIRSQYPNVTTEAEASSLKLGGTSYTGARLELRIEQVRVEMSFYSIPMQRGSLVLALQDALEDGAHSSEWTELLELFDRSFSIERPK